MKPEQVGFPMACGGPSDGPGVVRARDPSRSSRADKRLVERGQRNAGGMFGGADQSAKTEPPMRDCLLAYEGRSCRALMARSGSARSASDTGPSPVR